MASFLACLKQPLYIAYALWTWRVCLHVPPVSCLWFSVLFLLPTTHFCTDHFAGVQLTLESMAHLSCHLPTLGAEDKNNCLLCPKAQGKILSGFHSHFCGQFYTGSGNNLVGIFFFSSLSFFSFFFFFFKLNFTHSTIIVSLDGDPGPIKIFGKLCFGSWWVSHTAVAASHHSCRR